MFFINVVVNFVELEVMMFDDKIWDVVSNEVAENVCEFFCVKFELWVNGGIDFVLYFDDVDCEFLFDLVLSVVFVFEGVDVVVVLIEKARERVEVKYVLLFEIVKCEKVERFVCECEEVEEVE